MTKRSAPSQPLALGVLAALAWFGILLQLGLSLRLAQASGQSVADGLIVYSGYFTVLTNLFVALVASAGLVAPRSRLFSIRVRGCVTTAIVLVGIGYHFLLREIWDPQGWQWVADISLHYVVPLASLAYWCLFPPRERLSVLAPLAWAAYPLAYFVYAIVRGELIGSYPYPFIDVGRLGYGATLTHGIGLLVLFAASGFGIRALASLRRQRPGMANGG